METRECDICGSRIFKQDACSLCKEKFQELKDKIEEMKCCMNCKHYATDYGDLDCPYRFKCKYAYGDEDLWE